MLANRTRLVGAQPLVNARAVKAVQTGQHLAPVALGKFLEAHVAGAAVAVRQFVGGVLEARDGQLANLGLGGAAVFAAVAKAGEQLFVRHLVNVQAHIIIVVIVEVARLLGRPQQQQVQKGIVGVEGRGTAVTAADPGAVTATTIAVATSKVVVAAAAAAGLRAVVAVLRR